MIPRCTKALLERRSLAPACDKLREVWAAFPNPTTTSSLSSRRRTLTRAPLGALRLCGRHYGPMRVLRPYESPDFLFQRDDLGMGVWVEAVTPNPSEKYPDERRCTRSFRSVSVARCTRS
jgi:hypothetical protein